MAAKEPDSRKVCNSRPMSIPSDIYDRLERCRIFPTESFGSVIDRHIMEHELLHLLLENPTKVLEAIKKTNIIIENRGDITPILQNPDIIRMVLKG